MTDVRWRWLPLILFAGCGDNGGDGAEPDAARIDAAALDAAALDAALDASPDAGPAIPLPGFGAITGMCGVIDEPILTADQPVWFQGELTFADRYDDPAERPLLTPGGQLIVASDNAGGSSIFSETFAFEWLARCELATLDKLETQIVYDIDGKKADLLIELDGRKVGVSVVRSVTFPFGAPPDPVAQATLIARKLDDLQLATTQVSAADLWTEQLVAVLAYDAAHAQAAMDAWNALDAATRGQALMVVAVTSGDDLFIYTDQ